MPARAIMFAGTGSDVGKSVIVAGLARHFSNQGLKVKPFKPQNMSNNAAVTIDGGEIGRAQAVQARAARVAPSVDMNPVLLKPQSEIGSQVVVRGKVFGTANARDYQKLKPKLMDAVLESFATLAKDTDLILVEGAGSASEVNLRQGDIANMGFAQTAKVPVVLVGDIDRGGVIASLVGTKAVIDKKDAETICGFVVNKFRGDPALFDDGMKRIARETGWKQLGLIPYCEAARLLPAEDALALDVRQKASSGTSGGRSVEVAVLAYPRVSNFDDFDPLRLEPGVELFFLRNGEPIPGDCDLVILPGSKSVIADLAALRKKGWHVDIAAHIRRGGRILGICGGYQMLGRMIHDPMGIEGPAESVEGLGYLDIETTLTDDKKLEKVSGQSVADHVEFVGYEMHMGTTTGPGLARPFVRFADGREDGAVSRDGLVQGCYVHGLFANDLQRASWLQMLGSCASDLRYESELEANLEAFAEHIARHVDCERLLKLARVPQLK